MSLIYDSDASTNTIKKSHYIFPKYTEAVFVTQGDATDARSIQPFTLSTFDGKVSLSPKKDSWTQTVMVEAKSSTGTTEYIVDDGDFANISPADRGEIDPTYGWTDLDGAVTSSSESTSTTKTKSSFFGLFGSTKTTTTTTITTTTGLVEEISSAVSRARFVSFKIEGLKPSTRHFIFFDKKNVDVWCKTGAGTYVDMSNLPAGHKYSIPGNKYVNATQYPIDGGPTTSHKTNAQGILEGVFFIQSNTSVNFPTGKLLFEVSDVNSVTNNGWTSYAKGVYTCSGEIDVYLQSTETTTTVTKTKKSGWFWVVVGVAVVASDETLKDVQENQSTDNVIDKLKALKVVDFKYKPELSSYGLDVKHVHTGTMAQQMQQIYPQAVQSISLGDKEVLAINYGELVPDLIKAIVQQDKLIAQLSQQIDDLDSKVKKE